VNRISETYRIIMKHLTFISSQKEKKKNIKKALKVVMAENSNLVEDKTIRILKTKEGLVK
jgi:hypothetical protein